MPRAQKLSEYPYGDRMIDENPRYYEDIEPECPNIAIVGYGKAKIKDWDAPVDIKHALLQPIPSSSNHFRNMQ